MLPNFIIVGAAKSGTTSLYHYCNQHPEIFMSRIKETHFFSHNNFNFSLSDYKKLFEDVDTESAIGEASPSYLFYNNTPQKIKKYIPNCKIIILLRNPAERLYSDFFHSKRRTDIPGSFSKFVEPITQKSNSIKDTIQYKLFRRGLYSDDVNNYIDVFTRERIFIGLFENLKSNPKDFMERIFRFLDVSDRYIPDYKQVHNPGGAPIIPLIPRLIKTIAAVLKPVLSKFISSYHLFALRKAVTKLNTSTKKPDLDPEIRKLITNKYYDDITKLQKLIAIDLSCWLE